MIWKFPADPPAQGFPGDWKLPLLRLPSREGSPSLVLLCPFLIFNILSYLPLKTMGCFSGRLMSAASDQKLFSKLCSPFNCSFDESVGEKVVSPSYSSAILTPPPLIFLKRSLVFPILLFSSVSLHWSLRKALSLLAILWNSEFRWVYLSFSPLPFASLLFTAICKPSSDNYSAFLHFFFLEKVLITASCTMSRTSVNSSSGTLSDLIPWIYL